MQPRQLGITKKIIRADRDVFDLEMTKYEDLSRMEDYLTQESNDSYPFPRRSFVFYPTVGVRSPSFTNINTTLCLLMYIFSTVDLRLW